MLAYLTAAAVPALVSKLIMIGSASFDADDARQITQRRLERLSAADQAEAVELLEEFGRDDDAMDAARMARLDMLFTIADHCAPLDVPSEVIEYQHDVNRSVWGDATALRASGELAERGGSIGCPVVVMHGDYDPHPLDGVVRPLSSVIRNLRVVVLERCGHLPWMERHASERFWALLDGELVGLL
jgi:pimeloyl-ACP methyl ester carboxylesterase